MNTFLSQWLLRISAFIALSLTYSISFSQGYDCFYDNDPPLVELPSDLTSDPPLGPCEFYIDKIYVYIVRKGDGTGGYDPTKVQGIIDRLTLDFFQAKIAFRLMGVEYIDDDCLYHVDPAIVPGCTHDYHAFNTLSTVAAYLNALASQAYNPNGISLYLQDEDCPFKGGLTISQTRRVLISGSYFGEFPNASFESGVVSHEFGHVLGLLHTHVDGVDASDPSNDDILEAVTRPPVSGNNCSGRADFFCTTAADPGIGANSDPNAVDKTNCDWNLDDNGPIICVVDDKPYSPPVINFMSYTRPDCMKQFSSEQIEVMQQFNEVATFITSTEPPTGRYVITADYSIYGPVVFPMDVVVKSPATLYVEGTMKFNPGKRLIIEPGAKVVVDGGTLSDCGGGWEGVVVQSNPAAPQLPASHQGYIRLINGAKIKNAKIGIYASGKAIVRASDAIFENNLTGVYLEKLPTGSLCQFGNCTFTLAPAIDQLFSATEGAVHAKLSEIRVVRFSGCEFTDTRGLSSTGLEYRAKGIESYHSSFNVSNESLFQGLEFGIDATQGLGSPVRFEVTDNCSFDNNLIGINCTGINNIKVTENDFNIGAYPDLQGAAAFHIGMAIENSTGYTVEGNTFLKDNAGGDKTIGIRVYDEDGTESNLVNGNTFDLLNVANQAEGKNTSVLAGLQYFCNTNLGHNTYDFFVSGQGIWPLQGNGLGAENEFSLNSTPDDFSDYNNESNTGITYFCLNEQGKVPVDYFNIEPVLVLQENTCPGDEVGGGSPPVPDPKNDKALLMQGFFNASAGLDSKRTQWITTIDGGDTGGLLGRIAQAAAADSSDLYQLLLSRSPWLSEAALEATIGRHDILSGQKLYGILTANPDGTRDPDIKALVESELSSQLSASIFNNIGGTTARTALLGEIGSYSLERSRYAHALVQQIMDDTIGQEADTLLAWLAQKESRWGDYAAAEMYLEMGDTVSVANLLDAAPGKYGLENQDLLEHEYFEQLLALWQANAANGMNGLDANAQAILKNIANTSTGIAGMKARAILNFAYGGRYFSEPALPGTTPPQWLFRPKLSLSTAATLAAFPNPARDAVTFTFEMPEEVGDAHISVANMGGANVAQIALSGKKGKVNWETSGMADGVYLCNLHFNGQKSATVKVVVMK